MTDSSLSLVILLLLLLIGIIDFNKYIIPNKLVLLLTIIGIIKFIISPETALENIISSAVVISFILLISLIVTKAKKTQSIGAGDIKLIAALTLIFGLPVSIIGIWFSSLIALTFYLFFKSRRSDVKLPFGFFLSIGFTLIYFINEFYLNL